MEQYYIKKGKKYIPIGWQEIGEYIPFGVWYSRKTEGGSSQTNILYWQPENEIVDIKKICKQINLTDEIVKVLPKIENYFDLKGISPYDSAKKISQEIIKG